MSRSIKFVLVLASSLGFAMSASSTVQAQADYPWGYNTSYPPAGGYTNPSGGGSISLVGFRKHGYAPTYSNYPSSGCCGQSASYYQPAYSSYYQPAYSVSYAPTCCSQGCCGSSCSSCCSGGCSTCYVPGCSSCSGGCSTGNCGIGGCSSGSCSNCTTNSVPASSGYISSPTPSPLNSSGTSRDIDERLNRLERANKQHHDFLREKHTDFNIDDPNPSGSFRGSSGSTVPSRNDRTRTESFPSTDRFSQPQKRPRPSEQPLLGEEEEVKKPALGGKIEPIAPTPKPDGDNEGSAIPLPAENPQQDVQTLRLQDRLTAKPVAPRQRMEKMASRPAPLAAKPSKKATKIVLDSSVSEKIVRN